MTAQRYRIILEKQEKSVNACALFYGMCQNPNCVNLTFEKGGTPLRGMCHLNFLFFKIQLHIFAQKVSKQHLAGTSGNNKSAQDIKKTVSVKTSVKQGNRPTGPSRPGHISPFAMNIGKGS